jgi:hypothetical protein
MVEETSSASVGETPEIKALCEEFKTLNPKAVAIKTRMDHIKKRLVDLSDGKPILSAGVSITTSSRKGSVDYGAIKGIQKMIEEGTLDAYRKPSILVTKITIVG